MMDEVFFTPNKRVRKSLISPEGNSSRRRNLFNVELEDEIVPLSPTSSELASPRTPGFLPIRSSYEGVSELDSDTGIIPARVFYGLGDKSPITDATSLLERVRKSLPESCQKVKMRLNFEDEPKTRKKRARSAGGGDSTKRIKKKQKLQYIPFSPKKPKKKIPKQLSKSVPRISGKKRVRYNFELFSTPSRRFFMKPTIADLTPPESAKKAKVQLLDKSVPDFISEEKDTRKENQTTQEFREIIQDLAEDDDVGIKDEVSKLLVSLDNDDIDESDDDETIKENVSSNTVPSTPRKFFSIFVSPKSDCTPRNSALPSPMTPLSARVRKMGLGDDQLQLDVGQNNLREVECPECHLFYCKGLPEDEITHRKYHLKNGLFKFKGWKEERIVGFDGPDRIVMIKNNDSKIKWDRALKVLEYIDEELGFPDGGQTPESIFLYIRDKEIIGVVGCIGISEAYRVLDLGVKDPNLADVCSEEKYPAYCGISRVWVDPRYRTKGTATKMIDSIRRNYVFGAILTKDQIAFSSPTVDGKKFAEKYCQRKDYLVYF